MTGGTQISGGTGRVDSSEFGQGGGGYLGGTCAVEKPSSIASQFR